MPKIIYFFSYSQEGFVAHRVGVTFVAGSFPHVHMGPRSLFSLYIPAIDNHRARTIDTNCWFPLISWVSFNSKVINHTRNSFFFLKCTYSSIETLACCSQKASNFRNICKVLVTVLNKLTALLKRECFWKLQETSLYCHDTICLGL
jgi:hypothetical protein